MRNAQFLWAGAFFCGVALAGEDFPKPYSAPCVEREQVFAFTEKPTVKITGNDKYEITFAVKGNCDVTVGIVDAAGVVARHLGSGVLGANAPAPFQKNSLQQTLIWNGKDDLGDYVKEPGKMKVRVQLGLKPEFDKRLGITNPKSLPPSPYGICIDESGIYLFYHHSSGWTFAFNCRIRKFDHDGKYIRTLVPPPANLPEEKLQGLGFIEYEAGRKTLHVANLRSVHDAFMAGNLPHPSLSMSLSCQTAISGGRIYYSSTSAGSSALHYLRTDGSFDSEGVKGRLFVHTARHRPYLAASPDGKWMYLAGDHTGTESQVCTVVRCSLEDDKPGEVFAGEKGKSGSDNGHFQPLRGIDCDSQGRLYVCDHDNNRLQVFMPDGKYAKTIPLDRPTQVRVHQKTGAIYVMQTTRVAGKSVNRMAKLTSYDNPKVEFFLDCAAGLMAVDSWTAKPRLWLYGICEMLEGWWKLDPGVRAYEEDDGRFRKIVDFGEEVEEELRKAGVTSPGGWTGRTYAGEGKMVCDPVREQAYFANTHKFDLRTGAWLGKIRLPPVTDDIAFDKRGYMHCHLNPSTQPGVGRLDPARTGSGPDGASHPECPYDYGVEAGKWLGILPVRDQMGAKFFQDGIGVNMFGDVAEQCNIYYMPKRDEEARSFLLAGNDANFAEGNGSDGDSNNYKSYLADVERRLKHGEAIYWIKPNPGVPLNGATVWTFNRNGELRDECAVTAGGFINGVMLDEEGATYFVNNRTRMVNGRQFLSGKGGIFGAGKNPIVADPITPPPGRKQPDAFTGTLIKVRKKGTLLSTATPIPLDERPARPPDLGQFREEAWIEGAEWMYAGASPIMPGGCSCPTMRFHTDWYKRTFVPEAYRHSFGVIDTAGNLILHLGQYGNLDSGYGPESKVPVAGDGIAFNDARMVSGTDRYLCFSDCGERILVLTLNCHAEETAPIAAK